MKRLLRVSLDTMIYSLITMLTWIILSIFVDKSLFNIFVLTYPVYYLSSTIKSIFATGANISKVKGNNNDVLSGITIGIIVSIISFGLLLLNIDGYINFMGINASKPFVIYAIAILFLQTIFGFILTKLYYESKNVLANKYSIIFYSINFLLILITSILIKNISLIIIITLSAVSLFVIYVVIINYSKFKFELNIGKWIKYNSVELSDQIFLGLAYLFGINVAFSYGEVYAAAFSFVGLITDTQWDIYTSISTVAKIDISRNNFNYKEHLKNAIKLNFMLIISSLLMFIFIYNFYDINLKIALIYLSFHIVDFLISPFFIIITVYLQLEYSTVKTTTNNLFSRILRLGLSFLRTPYCPVIAQTSSSLFRYIIMNYNFNKQYKIDKDGNVLKK